MEHIFRGVRNSFQRKPNKFSWAHQIWWVVVVLCNVQGILAIHQFALESTTFFAYLSLANLTVTVLVRNELLLTFLYWSFKYIPWFKFPFHRMLHSIGGLHFGAGIATDVWIFVYLVDMFSRIKFNGTWPEWIMRTTVVIIAIGLTLMIVTALPPIRARYHNVWENTHRFVGWLSLLALVLHVIAKAVTTNARETSRTPLPYLTLICIASVFYIWITVRRVPITTHSPRGGISIIKFPGRPTMSDGTVARVSFNLLEWHAFSIAMVDCSTPEFGIIVAPAGDWTCDLVEKVICGEQPNTMWIRGVNPPGFMHMHRIALLLNSDRRCIFKGRNTRNGCRNCTMPSPDL
jgi:hypothetical protein